MTPIIHDCAQRSPEWFAARLGKLTGSRAADMLATIKSGEAAARRDLRMQLVCERLTGQSQENGYINADMQRGIDLEPLALAAYESQTGALVQAVGFLEHPELPAGCSPDGLIGDDGMIEMKCPKSATHLGYLRSLVIPTDYQRQIIHNLWISGRQWCDFVSFDDRFPAPLNLVIMRMSRPSSDVTAYELSARLFLGEVAKEVDLLRNMASASAVQA